ncbi:MAG: HAD family phosphatase [Butyricicoccus sp.]|nr:HAD family phosphatase [Butyricicoccus sp.]
MQPHIRAAIFDMDGTLLDSMPVYHNLTRGYLAGLGVTVERAELDALEGKTQRQWAEYFCAAYPQIGMAPEAFDAEIDRIVEARYAAIAVPKPGCADFLAALRDRGVRMAVATLTARRHAEKALRDRGLFAYFDCMLTIEDVGVPKYEPDIYLETARRLGVPPEESMVFEDAPYAGETAHRAGFRVCGVAERAYARGEEALRAASDWFIEASFDELREKLQYFG